MKLAFVALRTALFAAGFLWLWTWVALSLRPYASALGGPLPAIGAFGALLPLILVPAGLALASALGLRFYTMRQAAVILPIATVIYYLAWKYGAAFFNRIVELR
jgi:hypothetical protein